MMGVRKREREGRPAKDSGRRKVRSGDQPTPAKAETWGWLLVTVVVVLIAVSVSSVILYRSKTTDPGPDPTRNLAPVPHGSVKTDVDYQEILRENSEVMKNGTHRHYTYPVLGYITPWNSNGYEMAKRFANKFTHLSPVWYDLKSQGSGLVLEGRHNADPGWILDIRQRGGALVLPRVVLEALPKEMLRKKKLMDKAVELIVSECREMDYDGIVLESWSRWMAYGVLFDPDLRNKALEFVKQLGQALHSVPSARNNVQHLQLIYVIGPPYSEVLQSHDFGPKDLRSLSNDVDAFSLMMYDFSSPQNPGPNAPLKWIQSTLQLLLGTGKGAQTLAHKILVGLNYYGNDFVISEDTGGGAIIGRDYLSLLEKHKPQLQWEKNSGEHFFLYVDDDGSRHVVFYPTLMSIFLRLEEVRVQGTGISIWEIGQGLDYFFDLL